LLRVHLAEIPRPNRPLHRLKCGVLADALALAAEEQCVVDLYFGMLDPLRTPSDDMLGVIAK
jgi:hypothetical protein